MTRDYYEELRRAVPGIRTSVDCPESICYLRYIDPDRDEVIPFSASVLLMVTHLNDSHKWSRERIADWLDSLDVDLTFTIPEEFK